MVDRRMDENTIQFDFETLVMDSGVRVSIFSLDGDIAFINKQAAQLFRTGTDVVGKNVSDIFEDSQAEQFKQRFTHVAKKNQAKQYVDMVDYPEIGKRWLLSMMKPVFSENDGVIYILVNTQDITKQKQNEIKAIESEEKIRSIFNNMQDCYFRADLEGNVLFLSPSIKNFFKFDGPIEALYGRSILEVFDNPEDREQAAKLRETFGKITDYEIKMSRYDGSSLVASVNSAYCYDDKGEIIGIEGTLRDITQRKKAEDELRELKDSLERKVKEQTIHLVKAKEMAETANQAKSDFLTNITHELMTPLHGILSFAELGVKNNEDLSPKKIQKYFEVINDSGNKLLSVLKNLLDFSRMNSGDTQYKLVTVNLLHLIKVAIDSMNGGLSKRKVEFSIPPSLENCNVSVDMEKMSSVFCNILDNAVKFSSDGSLIDISVRKNDDCFEVRIQDEGIGVPVEEVADIFEQFSQRSNCKKMVASGAGFGLAISKEIIDAHNGSIAAVIPKNGIGLCLIVNIPEYIES